MEENNDIQLENSNNESNSTAVTKPKSWFTVIYKKIPGLLSWGFTSKECFIMLVIVFVGTPTFLQMRNLGFYQWIVHNGGFKKESLAALGIRPY